MHVKSVMLAVAMTALSCDSAFAAPLGSWSFTNGLADDTGNSHTLTNGTGATVSNGAIHFTATDDTVWARTTNTIPLNGVKTMAPFFWVRCDTDKQPAGQSYLVEFLSGASRAAAGDLSFTVEGASGGYILMSLRLKTTEVVSSRKSRNGVLADGEWHCVAANLGSGSSVYPTCELYIDGVLDSTIVNNNTGGSTFTSYKNETMHLARRGGASASETSFCGDLDEIAVYGSLFSAADIRSAFYRTLSFVYHNDESKYQHRLPDGIRSKDGALLVRVRVKGNASVTCDNAVETTGEKVFWVPDGATATLTVTSADVAGQRVTWANRPADAIIGESGKTVSFAVNAPQDLFVDAFVPTHVWTGAASEDFADAANWADATGAAVGAAPNGSDDIVYIPAGLDNNPTASAAISVGNLYIGELTNGTQTVTFTSSTGDDHTIAGNLVVLRGAKLTQAVPGFSASAITTDRRLNLVVAGDMTVEANASLDVSKLGFQAQKNNDNKYRGSGYPSCHGGLNAASATGACYGSIREPTTFGAPGGSWGGGAPGYGVGGHGGGAIRLTVTGTLMVYGSILANGANNAYCCGGGAGGSIWITAADLHGAGTITARPGYGYTDTTKKSTVAGGGRLALYLTDAADASSFTGTIDALDGTYYTQFSGDEPGRGTLIVTGTMIRQLSNQVTGSLEPFKKIVITGGAGTLLCKGIVYPLATDVETGTGKLQADATSVLDIRSSAGAPRKISGNVQAAALVCTNAGGAVEFAAGSAVTIDAAGSLTLLGEEGGMLTMACPQTDGKWTLSVGSGVDPVIQYVAVSNSTAVTAVTDKDGADLGGNTNWLFTHSTGDGSKITWLGLNDDWGDPSNWQDEQGQVRGVTEKDAAIIPSGCTVYPQLKKHTAVWALSVAEGAALDLNNFNLSISHDFANTGTVTCVGAEQITVVGNVTFGDSDVFVPANSTLVLAGTAAQTADLCGNSFNVISAEVSGEDRGVSFLNGFAAQKFTCMPTNDIALTFSPEGVFDSVAWQVVAASGGDLSLNSTAAGTYWHLKARPGAVFSGVTVNDSDASSGATVYSSDYTGDHNVNWSAEGTFWTGGASTSWNDPGNWSGGVPDATKVAIVLPSEKVPVIGEATSVRELIVGNGVDAAEMTVNAALTVVEDLSIVNFGKITANKPIVVSNDVTIASGGVITHAALCGGKVDITVLGDMSVSVRGKVDVTQCGYSGSFYHDNDGPGASAYMEAAAPAAYGGRAASAIKPCYGSIRQPIDWGSGGFHWQVAYGTAKQRSGGGAIRLSVAGILTVDGEIRADGCSPEYAYNTGTGGSIWLSAAVLRGGGTISCRPGKDPDPQGGGRMAIYQTEATDLSAFTGTFDSREGTRYIENNGDVPGRGMLILDGSMFVDFFTNQVRAALGAADGDQPFGRIVCTGTMTGNVKDGILVKVCGDVVATNATVAAEEGTAGGLEILGAAEGVTHLAGTFRLGSFVCTNGTAALEFAAGTSVTNYSNGTLWLDGATSSGGKMALRSSVTGQAWYLNAGTNLAGKVQNLDVSDSDASGGQTIKAKRSSSKRARNPNWEFPAGFALIIR